MRRFLPSVEVVVEEVVEDSEDSSLLSSLELSSELSELSSLVLSSVLVLEVVPSCTCFACASILPLALLTSPRKALRSKPWLHEPAPLHALAASSPLLMSLPSLRPVRSRPDASGPRQVSFCPRGVRPGRPGG